MSRLARWRYRRLVARMAGPKLLRAFAAAYPSASFVEIGANDGSSFDPLHPIPAGWRGILVEPVPHMFARLRETVGDRPGLRLVNAAVAAEPGRLPFYHLAEADPSERAALPDFYDSLGSLHPETLLSHDARLADRMVEIEVEAVTFGALVSDLERLDLLAVDTEGHDWEILRHADLGRHRPRLVLYEHFHLAPADRRAARDHLRGLGFETFEEGLDTFCLDTEPADELTARWRELRPALPGMSRFD